MPETTMPIYQLQRHVLLSFLVLNWNFCTKAGKKKANNAKFAETGRFWTWSNSKLTVCTVHQFSRKNNYCDKVQPSLHFYFELHYIPTLPTVK